MFYRIYPLGPDGRFLPAIELECESDAAAIDAVVRMGPFAHGCEVWQLQRYLGRYRADADRGVERIG